mgnify:CR=1 FL=1
MPRASRFGEGATDHHAVGLSAVRASAAQHVTGDSRLSSCVLHNTSPLGSAGSSFHWSDVSDGMRTASRYSRNPGSVDLINESLQLSFHIKRSGGAGAFTRRGPITSRRPQRKDGLRNRVNFRVRSCRALDRNRITGQGTAEPERRFGDAAGATQSTVNPPFDSGPCRLVGACSLHIECRGRMLQARHVQQESCQAAQHQQQKDRRSQADSTLLVRAPLPIRVHWIHVSG